MKRLFFYQLLVFITLLSCDNKPDETNCPDVPLENPTLTDELEYGIMNSILTNYYTKLSFIHVLQATDVVSTTSIDIIKEVLTYYSIDYDTASIVDYSEKNEVSYFLSNELLVSTVQLMNPKELDCFMSFTGSVWEKYYQKYPNSVGFFTFSRPGINAHDNKAIVEYSRYSNYESAVGYLVILEKVNGSWTIIDRIDMWAA